MAELRPVLRLVQAAAVDDSSGPDAPVGRTEGQPAKERVSRMTTPTLVL